MIGYVRGKVTYLFHDHCFVDVNGLGYRVYISNFTRQRTGIGEEVILHTYLHVREDAMLLFGFFSQEEYQLFISLISVTGIGPKVALGILSSISPSEFRLAVANKSIATLTKMPGIGKKTAERLILELKDKIGTGDSEVYGTSDQDQVAETHGDVTDEVLAAMIALGYSQTEVSPILRRVFKEGQTVEETIRLALKEAARR